MSSDIRTSVRLTEALNTRLEAAAARNRRSAHAQMLVYIELGLAIDEGAISNTELLALNDPAVRSAVAAARAGDHGQLRPRES